MRQLARHRQLLTIVILTAVVIVAILATPTHAFSLTAGINCASSILNVTGTITAGSGYYYTFGSSVDINVQASVYSNVPVEIAVVTSGGQIVYSSQSSTELVGSYSTVISQPGTYWIGVYIPSQGTAIINGWLNITMCGPGATQTWLSQFTQLWPTDVVSNGVNLTMAPMGIVAYGVIEAGGQYYAYTLATDAVEGVVYIPQGVSASDYYPDGTYYGNTFSVQLNAYVVAKLANGQTQYYWIQDVVGLSNGQLWVWNNVWNETTYISHLSSSAIHGNGGVYFGGADHGYYYYYGMQSPVPFGWVTLEMSAYASGGSAVVDFYANGQLYDTVTITPSSPVTSASIVISPTESFRTTPLDLELVLAGHDSGIPYAVLQSGSISMSLYVDMDGHWVPPPSAWTVGYSTYEESYSDVVPNGFGSAVVKPGAPDVEELWSGTVIVSLSGVFVTTSTDLTQYASQYFPQVVSFNNGTRLVLEGVVINGQPEGLNALSSVPLGSLVLATYTKQYLVSIYAPTNTTTTWVDAGTPILIDEPQVINFGNGTRLINPTLNGEALPATIVVSEPLDLTVTYTRQYYVVINAPGNVTSGWFDEGSTLYIQPTVTFDNGTRLVNPTPSYITVNNPMTVTITYTRQYLVSILAPMNVTEGWFNEGSTVLIDEPGIINLGNGTRLVNPTLNGEPLPTTITVSTPLELVVSYTRQYLVTQTSIFGEQSAWVSAGVQFMPNATVHVVNGVTFKPTGIVVNGVSEPITTLTVSEPMNVTITYLAVANVSTTEWGLPALYARATMTCGTKSASATGYLTSELTLSMPNPPTYECTITTSTTPLTPIIIVTIAIAAAATAALRRRRRRTRYYQIPIS